jgi:hypothetical protein
MYWEAIMWPYALAMLHVHVAGRVLAWWLRSRVAFEESPTGVAHWPHSCVKQ